ncbi:hypothetical protein O0L34_g11376 [Tuta absoluta]|nr:hypothetical protein O0L34_g11376 [Tuta absoluta]
MRLRKSANLYSWTSFLNWHCISLHSLNIINNAKIQHTVVIASAWRTVLLLEDASQEVCELVILYQLLELALYLLALLQYAPSIMQENQHTVVIASAWCAVHILDDTS